MTVELYQRYFRFALHLLVFSVVPLFQSFLDSKLQFLYGVGGDYEHEGKGRSKRKGGCVEETNDFSFLHRGEIPFHGWNVVAYIKSLFPLCHLYLPIRGHGIGNPMGRGNR